MDTAPELLLSRHQDTQIERVHGNGDLDPLAAPSDDRQHRRPAMRDAHIVLDLGLIQNGSRAFYVITGEQIRLDAAFLDGPNLNLQNVQNFSLPTVKRVEAGTGPRVSDEARRRIQQALERGGAQFIAENGGGPGGPITKSVRGQERPKSEFLCGQSERSNSSGRYCVVPVGNHRGPHPARPPA